MSNRVRWIIPILGVCLLVSTACNQPKPASDIVAEGVIYSVHYKLDEERTGGFTRVNSSAAVPGRNGSWNVDAYGKLTREYLIITYPQRKGLDEEVIPANRLIDIQFGDGGIKSVDENHPAKP